MASNEDDHPATTKFKNAIPFALLPASHNLAALHVARLRPLTNPSIQSALQESPFCLKCGSSYTHSDGEIRIIRRKKKKKPMREDNQNAGDRRKQHARVLRRSCNICGWIRVTPIEQATHEEPSRPKTRAEIVASVSPPALQAVAPKPSVKSPSPADASAKNSEQASTSTGRSKSRPKNKSVLQEMLARNRKIEASRSQSSQSTGLGAFLESL